MKKKLLIGFVLFLIALLLRLPGISFHSLWFDETSTVFCVTQSGYGDMLKAVHTTESTPPLFFFLEKIFIDLFHLKLNELSLRFLPMLFGVLTCLIYFLLFREIGGGRTSFFAFFLIAFSNFYLFTSQNARVYSLLCLLVFLTLLLTVRWWKKPSRGYSIAFFISVVVTVQAHYYAALWVTALFISVLIIKFKDIRVKHYLSLLASSGVLSFAFLIPLFLAQVHYEINPIRDYLLSKWIPGIAFSPIKVILGAYLFKINSLREITIFDVAGIVPVVLLIAIAAFFFLRRLREKTVSDSEKIVSFSVIAAFCLHVMIGWKVPSIHPQYMEHFLLLLFGLIMVNTSFKKSAQVGAFCILLALNIAATVRYYGSSKPYLTPWRNIAAAVDSCMTVKGKNSETVLGEYTTCLPIAFYLKNESASFYQIDSPFNPNFQHNFARLNLFGNAFITDLFHFKYFPMIGQISFMDIIKKTKQGFLVDNRYGAINSFMKRLIQIYDETIEFSVIKTFGANNGEIALIYWKYKGVD